MRLFPGAKIDDMYHYLTPISNKNSYYIFFYVFTNDAVNTCVSTACVIIQKLLRLKCFIKQKLPNWKVILSRLIQRADNKVAT